MSRVAPESRVVDLSHFIAPLDVASGARLLSDSLAYLPDDAVLLAVVDPNVGADRDIAVETAGGRLLVGPDNGLLSSTWAAAGGSTPRRRDHRPSRRRHADRTVVSRSRRPVPRGRPPRRRNAARGARTGDRPRHAHRPSSPRARYRAPDDPVRGDRPQPLRQHPAERPRARSCARPARGRPPKLAVEAIGGWVEARRGETYADFAPGEYGVIFDPRGWLMIVRGNPGNALQDLRLSVGDMVWITAAGADRTRSEPGAG